MKRCKIKNWLLGLNNGQLLIGKSCTELVLRIELDCHLKIKRRFENRKNMTQKYEVTGNKCQRLHLQVKMHIHLMSVLLPGAPYPKKDKCVIACVIHNPLKI